MQGYPLPTETKLEEPLPPIGREVFLSLPDEEKYHHFLELFDKVQELEFEIVDAREGLHQLQTEGLKHKILVDENKKLSETVRELQEKLEIVEKTNLGEFTLEREEVENLKREIAELQQALLIDQEEKQCLLKEKEILEGQLQVQFDHEDLSPELLRAKDENKLLRQELQKIKEVVLQGLKEAKELKIKATSALHDREELEKNFGRYKSEAEALKREKGHLEEMVRKFKGEGQQLLYKMKDELDLTKKELEQAKISLAKRVKEVTLLEEVRDEERVTLLERIKKLEDLLQTERAQREAEIARVVGGEELLIRLSPHIEALHRMVVEKGKANIALSDHGSPSLFDALNKGPFLKERLF